jgi:hypothetical protein
MGLPGADNLQLAWAAAYCGSTIAQMAQTANSQVINRCDLTAKEKRDVGEDTGVTS